ncbi:MAG: kinase/pyrophosphorylase [Pseudomonadales bacterium]|nr:kinase/pyrophosphorylase [Pseudomonadales bacterium]
MQRRSVFFISDSTGITAQTLGQSVLSQFESVEFEHCVIPNVNSIAKVHDAIDRINKASEKDKASAIVFDTLLDEKMASLLDAANCLRFNMLETYIKPLEKELNTASSHTVGRAHGQINKKNYDSRIDAVHFAMDNDDGARTHYYDKADIILTGVSRSGKTPTCLYLALQHGIYAANYPITEEDLESMEIPSVLKPYRKKLFGLTISPERLTKIRHERKSNSRYASIRQCQMEIAEVEAMLRRIGVAQVDVTDLSIEEIAAAILEQTGLGH